MRYLIAATAPNLEAKIAKRFGHAPYFLVLDPETHRFEAIKGPDEKEPSYGISRFTGKDIERVILGNIGPHAFRDLITAGWEIYACIGMSVKDAVDKVRKGEVAPLRAPTMKHSIRPGLSGTGGRR